MIKLSSMIEDRKPNVIKSNERGHFYYSDATLVAHSLEKLTFDEICTIAHEQDDIDMKVIDFIMSRVVRGMAVHTDLGLRIGKYYINALEGELGKLKIVNSNFSTIGIINHLDHPKELFGKNNRLDNFLSVLMR